MKRITRWLFCRLRYLLHKYMSHTLQVMHMNADSVSAQPDRQREKMEWNESPINKTQHKLSRCQQTIFVLHFVRRHSNGNLCNSTFIGLNEGARHLGDSRFVPKETNFQNGFLSAALQKLPNSNETSSNSHFISKTSTSLDAAGWIELNLTVSLRCFSYQFRKVIWDFIRIDWSKWKRNYSSAMCPSQHGNEKSWKKIQAVIQFERTKTSPYLNEIIQKKKHDLDNGFGYFG